MFGKSLQVGFGCDTDAEFDGPAVEFDGPAVEFDPDRWVPAIPRATR